jgi:flagellar biosynthesis protein FlhG
MPRIVTITSGKGGVGKTNISVNLALELARRGFRTCLFDADMGLANINILLGLYPEKTLADVISGDKRISDIIIRNYQGVDIVPGSSGISKLAALDSQQIEPVIAALSQLDHYDFLLFDTSAGAGNDVTTFCRAASEMLLIITPEPTSLTDAYALLKILSSKGFNKPVRVVINLARHLQHAKIPYQSLSQTVSKHLPIVVSALGFITQDSHVTEAVRLQKPFLSLYPKSMASTCIQKIADRLISTQSNTSNTLDMKSFWSEYLMLCRKSPPPETPNTLRQSSASHPASERYLADIARSLSNISSEIKMIRKILTPGSTNQTETEVPLPPTSAPEQPIKPILLDFEAYLTEKQKERKR